LDVVRKDVGWAGAVHMANLLDASVRYAYAHKKEAVSYALKYGRGIDRKIGEKFVQMYVNEDTLHMGQKGEDALRLLFKMALEKKWLSKTPRFSVVHPDFAIK